MMKYFIASIKVVCLIIVININGLPIVGKVFKEEAILSETQIFLFKDKYKIDSIRFEYFSKNQNDTLNISLFKDKNYFREKLDPELIFNETLETDNKGINLKTINLTENNIIIEREELYFEFISINGTSRLITNTKERASKCDTIINDRVQYFSTANQKILGKSAYKVEIYTSIINEINLDYSLSNKFLDSTILVPDKTNLVSIDINKDGFIDVIINNNIYINNAGYLNEHMKIFDDNSGYLYISDLNNDKLVEILKINDGIIESITINNDVEIINRKNIVVENLLISELHKLESFDYDKDGNQDLILIKDKSLSILRNTYPNIELIDINIDSNSNISISHTDNKIYNHNEVQCENSEFYDISSEYGFYFGGKYKIIFKNTNGDSLDKIILLNQSVEEINLTRRILTPKKYYTSKLEQNDSRYFLFINSCECETNHVFKQTKNKLEDYTEKSNLKFLNLQNTLFVDLNNDGYKEILSVENNRIKIFERTSRPGLSFKRITSNSNIQNIFNKSNKKELLKQSTTFTGINQSYGLIDFLDSEVNEGDTLMINGIEYEYQNSNYSELSNPISDNLNVTTTPNPFFNYVRFNSNNFIIDKITIYNTNGSLVYSNEFKSNYAEWNGKSNENELLSQGVYYYEVSFLDSKIIEKGNIIKVEQ